MSAKIMRASHIVYNVSNLDDAVKEWEEKGFHVEYAQKSHKHNALVLFSEGPFIELLEMKSIGFFTLFLASIVMGKEMADGMKKLKPIFGNLEKDTGLFSIEKDNGGLEEQIAVLEKHGIRGKYVKNVKRTDPKGNKMRWKLFFPYNVDLPFLMSYYNIDPKPKNFVHPNGVKGIKSLKLVTSKEAIEVLQELVDDPIIEFVEGDEHSVVHDVEFYY